MLSTVQSNLEATWPDDVARFMFSFEMVDEMVECCDAADENLEVLNSVAKNKKEGAEAEADENTTIGFGGGGEKGPVLAVPPPAGPPAAPTAAPTMMVVKKKKKAARPPPSVEGEGGAKKAKVEEP